MLIGTAISAKSMRKNFTQICGRERRNPRLLWPWAVHWRTNALREMRRKLGISATNESISLSKWSRFGKPASLVPLTLSLSKACSHMTNTTNTIFQASQKSETLSLFCFKLENWIERSFLVTAAMSIFWKFLGSLRHQRWTRKIWHRLKWISRPASIERLSNILPSELFTRRLNSWLYVRCHHYNGIDSMTLTSSLNPRSRFQVFSADWPNLNIMCTLSCLRLIFPHKFRHGVRLPAQIPSESDALSRNVFSADCHTLQYNQRCWIEFCIESHIVRGETVQSSGYGRTSPCPGYRSTWLCIPCYKTTDCLCSIADRAVNNTDCLKPSEWSCLWESGDRTKTLWGHRIPNATSCESSRPAPRPLISRGPVPVAKYHHSSAVQT